MKKVKLPRIKIKKSFWAYMGVAAALIVGLIISILIDQPDGKLHVNFYDVGQGDAALIETPENHQILIDGGPDSTILSKLSADIPFYDRSLDLIIVTHPHADHINGLIDVLEHYQVDQILYTGVTHNTPNYLEFLELVREKEIETRIAKKGMKIEYGDGPELRILWPEKSLRGDRVDKLNNSSIVVRLNYQKKSILFTGDFENTGQDEIQSSDLKKYNSDVLKIPHHGSRDSLNNRFLKAVSPKYAIISVAVDNRFGHPHKELLLLLKNIKLYRTDEAGDIEVVIGEDKKIEISAQKPV